MAGCRSLKPVIEVQILSPQSKQWLLVLWQTVLSSNFSLSGLLPQTKV